MNSLLNESKHQVNKEIPECDQAHGEKLGNIEILIPFTYQKPDYKGIHSQSNNRD